MQMFLISDNIDTYTGMRLAGVEGVVVHTHDELKDALQKAISNKEIGIILLTEKFGREFPEIIDDVKLHHKTPLIIEIPIVNLMLLFTHHYLETYKPKSHCRRQSGMNFGYVTVNGVNSYNLNITGRC